jgi:two-component system, OmpR family, response regulator CpxR
MGRILIVDDDVELCHLIAQFLEPEGFVIEAEHDGARAVERALAEPHDLVVLDVMLPGMNGFEVLRRIRAQSGMPILMLTARGEDVDRITRLNLSLAIARRNAGEAASSEHDRIEAEADRINTLIDQQWAGW